MAGMPSCAVLVVEGAAQLAVSLSACNAATSTSSQPSTKPLCPLPTCSCTTSATRTP